MSLLNERVKRHPVGLVSAEQALKFGSGHFVGEALNNEAFHRLDTRDQARALGWAAGCPVVEELTDPDNTNSNRGPDAMRNRYAQLSFWFTQIIRTVAEHNPELGAQLQATVLRNQNEPVGKFEESSVPDNYSSSIPPTETLVGFVLPRIFTKYYLHESEARTTTEGVINGLDVIGQAAVRAQSPEDLVVIIAESVAIDRDQQREVLAQILPTGWLLEHNGISMVTRQKEALSRLAPVIWQYYCVLSKEEKASYKIL